MHTYTRPEDRARIQALEAARAVYGYRRMVSLMADNVEPAKAWAIVQAEIASGAAVQALPVTITRTVGDGNAD